MATIHKAARSTNKTNSSEVLGPLAFITAAIGVILGAVDSVTKMIDLVEGQFYLATGALWIASILLARRYWPPKKRSDRFPSRRLLQIMLTLVFLTGVGWKYYEQHLRKTHPASPPKFKLSDFIDTFRISSAYAAERNTTNPLRLVSFYLNEDLSSFHESNEPLFAAGKVVKTYSVDRSIYQAFQNGRCIGVSGEQPQKDVLPLLRRRLEAANEKELLPYVSSEESFARLARERGDIFDKVVFSPAELSVLQKQSPSDYEVAKEWILNCVGVYQPVFTLVLRNSGSTPLDIVQVVYRVEQVGQVAGAGPSGPVFPEYTYEHILKHTVGDQPNPLKPIFHIEGSQTKSFNLRLLTDSDVPGLGWLLRIAAEDSDGHIVETTHFQLYLNRERSLK